MKSRSIAVALLLLALPLAACQTMASRAALDGRWASGDGVSETSFAGGRFTTRFVKTNEVLAQGSYTPEGDRIRMDWVSLAAQERRSAVCTITSPDTMRCSQPGSSGFDLTRA